jgi:hypothetical protein
MGKPGALRKVINAIVNDQPGIEPLNEVAGQRGGQKSPDNRAGEVHDFHPPADSLEDHKTVDKPGGPGVWKRQHNGRVEVEVFLLPTKPPGAPPPVHKAPLKPRQVLEGRSTDPCVLNKQDAIPMGRQGRHNLLVPLPDKVPVNGGKADNVLTFDHKRSLS